MNITTDKRARVPGAGIDADPERRPGVPMEADPPRPVGAAHWKQPERQPDPGYVLKRKGLSQLTPVFGTAVRRAASRVPWRRFA